MRTTTDASLQPLIDAMTDALNARHPGGGKVSPPYAVPLIEFLAEDYMGTELGALHSLFGQLLRYSTLNKGKLYWRIPMETALYDNGVAKAYARLVITEQMERAE